MMLMMLMMMMMMMVVIGDDDDDSDVMMMMTTIMVTLVVMMMIMMMVVVLMMMRRMAVMVLMMLMMMTVVVAVEFSGGYKCADPNWYRVSQDAPGCRPAHREAADLRRLLGNKPVNHTNAWCSFRQSASCQQARRRGHGPHTFDYRTSDTPLFGDCVLLLGIPLIPVLSVVKVENLR